jgi:hypothetical protein
MPNQDPIPQRQFPASRELALAPRKQGLNHPWNRGFPNNKKLRRLAKKPESDRGFDHASAVLRTKKPELHAKTSVLATEWSPSA